MPNLKHLWPNIDDMERITQILPLLTYGENQEMKFDLPVASIRENPGKVRDTDWSLSKQRKHDENFGPILKATDNGFVQTATRAENQIDFEAKLPRSWSKHKRLSARFGNINSPSFSSKLKL